MFCSWAGPVKFNIYFRNIEEPPFSLIYVMDPMQYWTVLCDGIGDAAETEIDTQTSMLAPEFVPGTS